MCERKWYAFFLRSALNTKKNISYEFPQKHLQKYLSELSPSIFCSALFYALKSNVTFISSDSTVSKGKKETKTKKILSLPTKWKTDVYTLSLTLYTAHIYTRRQPIFIPFQWEHKFGNNALIDTLYYYYYYDNIYTYTIHNTHHTKHSYNQLHIDVEVIGQQRSAHFMRSMSKKMRLLSSRNKQQTKNWSNVSKFSPKLYQTKKEMTRHTTNKQIAAATTTATQTSIYIHID